MEIKPKIIANSLITIAMLAYLFLLKRFNNLLLASRRSADNDIVWAIESVISPDFWIYFAIGLIASAGLGYLSYLDLVQLNQCLNPSWGDINVPMAIIIILEITLKIVLLVSLVILIVNPIIRILIIVIFFMASAAGILN